jgi:hypothetical protein
VADQERPRGAPWKGVLFGVLTDIVGTTAAAVLLSMVYGIVMAASGVSVEEMTETLAKPDPTSLISIIGMVIGTGFSVLGGYVCARVARQDELKWASLVAVASVVISFLMSSQAYGAELHVLFGILTIAAVMAGGYLGARHNLKA